MQHYFECLVLWEVAGAIAGGGLVRSLVDRMALGDVVEEAEHVGTLARLVCAFSIHRSVKVPWAVARPCGTNCAAHSHNARGTP